MKAKRLRHTLQRPSAVELAWLAGWLEGEGCFLVHKNDNGLAIVGVSTDKDVLDKAARIMQRGTPKLRKKAAESHKQQWDLSIYGDSARMWMLWLLPHMGERRQARIKECLASSPGFITNFPMVPNAIGPQQEGIPATSTGELVECRISQ